MLKKRVAQGSIGTAFASSATVFAVTWPQLDPAIGIPLLIFCGFWALASFIWLLKIERDEKTVFETKKTNSFVSHEALEDSEKRNKEAQEDGWEPTEAEIREECAASGNPLVEPYLTEARDQLLFERAFDERVRQFKEEDRG